MIRLPIAASVLILLGFTHGARAQFFFPGATSFTPEISVVNSGAILDAQAVVTADRKHVTINARPTNTAILALNNFTFQNGQNAQMRGFVGDPPPLPPVKTGVDGSSAGNDPATAIRRSPTEILQYARSQASLLHRDGMTRISRLKG